MEINKINSTLSASLNISKSVDTLKKTLVSDHLSTSTKQDISDDWQLLEQTHRELQTILDVDMDKVAAIRQAMSNDSFELSLDKIAEKMLIQHGK